MMVDWTREDDGNACSIAELSCGSGLVNSHKFYLHMRIQWDVELSGVIRTCLGQVKVQAGCGRAWRAFWRCTRRTTSRQYARVFQRV